MKRTLLVLAVLVAAGCVQPEPGTPAALPGAPAAALPFPDPMGQDHDHDDATLHKNAYQVEFLDHHPLAGSPTHASGAHAFDVRAGYLFAAVYGGEADREGGVFIFDVADPTKPKEVGRYRFVGPLAGDRSMEATDDGNWILLGTELVDCGGNINPFAPGLHLIDARDKANPKLVDIAVSRGVHSVTVANLGGHDYVYASVSGTGADNIYRVDKSAGRLVAVGSHDIDHDSIVVHDPLHGGPLAFIAHGEGGFEVWDLEDPTDPRVLTEWDVPGRQPGQYYVHTGAVQFIDGRRILVVSSEDFTDYASPLWVLDATDLAAPELLATWTNPGGHPADAIRYSLHNPRFVGNVLVITHYHGGLWALDLSTPESPRIVGQYMPDKSNGWRSGPTRTSVFSDQVCGEFHVDSPFTVDVEEGDGVLYVADYATGLYTVRPLW